MAQEVKKQDVVVEPAVAHADFCAYLSKQGYTLLMLDADQTGFKTVESIKVFGKTLANGDIEVIIPSKVKVRKDGTPVRATATIDLLGAMTASKPNLRAIAKANAETLGIKFNAPDKGSRGKSNKVTVE